MRLRVLLKQGPPGAQGALRGVEIGQFAQQVPKAAQHRCGNTVARRHRIVAEGLAAMNELFMIRGGEEKSAGLCVLELREQDGAERLRELQVAAAPAGLQQLE